MSDLTATREALDTWETKLASAHGWDIDHDTTLTIITLNDFVKRVLESASEISWCQTHDAQMGYMDDCLRKLIGDEIRSKCEPEGRLVL